MKVGRVITPHVVTTLILTLIIFVAWVFGMVGTNYNVDGIASIATSCIFSTLLTVHAIVLLILTMFRTKDTRMAWTGYCNRMMGRKGRYAFSQDALKQRNPTYITDGIGLESSIHSSNEQRYVEHASSAEEKRAMQKEEEIVRYSETIIANQSTTSENENQF